MIPRRRWFDRTFVLCLPANEFPELLERLRGTPARLEERVRAIGREALIARPAGDWSIQEHAGHLLELEPLWRTRLEDMLRKAPDMRAADLENRGTYEARYNDRPVQEVLDGFRTAREGLVARLEGLDAAALDLGALHPRLRESMNVVGLCLFVAEHDDHHLATITRVLHATRPGPAG